ncbi:type I polyketide synthase [Desulfobacula toluolica]|uniref:Predicted polyketide synthase n=1 Tax=Desulfobacula toluolica (strain DSM 7467 / Tol2) TaxID=651182 RepID=K0NBP9_DESTT|nr:type I polyketide synthase [Desulfobacula toluolica]CCK81789.1 predicted polyketide synthase [Desulfobacula toluolica Tol2]
MIRRILNSRLPLMVYNPVKVFDIKYFIEIFNAGALPVFDTEFIPHDEILQNARLLSREKLSFGIRLSNHDTDLIEKIKHLQMVNLDLLVCPLSKDDTPADFSNFADTKIVLEIKDININDKIKSVDPHALVLKGNEAGGMVSKYSSFILMQWYLKNSGLPLFIHGGVGKYTAAGMFAAGVSGLVMDSQFLMTDEAPVSDNFKKLLGMVDESDSTDITVDGSDIYRVFAKLGTKIVKDLKLKAVEFADDPQGRKKLYELIEDNMTAFDKTDVQFIQSLFYLGQDGIFAKDFIKESSCLGDIISSLFKTIGENLNFIDEFDPVKPDSAFAEAQGTKFPLIQGPMANISDSSDFANKVLEQGALPFFAVGSLPEQLADDMLKDGARKVDNFGAGLVGIEAFNPSVKQHLDMVKKYKVPYALFAGGIPSQVAELEKAGTKTYLHTPSISMMENALKSGCKRFIFEGGEAGGHVGTLSSMVLWEAAIAALINKEYDLSDLYLVFAGGISTCFASFFVSGFASFLAAKGAKIGIQVGTAYLFADEIVETKCIKPQYRDIILKENETMLIGKSLGLASRTAPTEFARMMVENEARMIKDKESLEIRKRAFEKRNIGSLLIGAKGFIPDFKNPGPEHYTWFEDDEHKEKGNFLVGDSLAFFDRPVTIKQIHDKYFEAKSTLYQNVNFLEIFSSRKNKINDEIAVVGIGCTLPHAHDPESLWENILSKKYSISRMPEERFDHDLYYDPDRSAEDKTYTTLAGHIDDFEFDLERFGYAEEKAKKLSRSQQMVLQTAYKAVENAGLLGENNQLICDDPSRTAVIVATCLSNELGNNLQLKYWYPELVSMIEKTDEYQVLSDEEKLSVKQTLLEGMEGENPGYDPVHGMLLNIEASRIARHLGIRGVNYIVDAACASSVTALDAGIGELLCGDHDQVIVGGVNTHLAPESFIGFAKMGTLSSVGSYPFDERASGFILGEGSVIFVLKRMKDAIRDKNRIFGVINSIGSSSDGKGKAIAAPNPAGQVLSVQRCFENIRPGIKPEDIGFIEAHGTSTTIGDQAELETLNSVYKNAGAGISSIKSQIGHLLGCAGSAGILKALLTVNKGMLPPNGQFETLSKNHNLEESSLFIVKDAKEWSSDGKTSRKAAVSSYGFGGINYHIVVEQMTQNYKSVPRDIFTDTAYDFNDDRIVVAGLGVFLPGAKNTEEFWEKLESGKKQLSDIPASHFDNDAYSSLDKKSPFWLPKVNAGVVKDYKFNNLKYRMPPMMVKSIERGQIFGLEAANEALESSGLLGQLSAANKVGTILGTIAGERQSKNIIRVRKHFVGNLLKNCSKIDSDSCTRLSEQLVESIRNAFPENNEDTTPGLLSNIISGRIANYFGLNGANYVIDASCASSFIAMRNAARNLKHKDLDFVLAGGVDCNLYPAVLMAFKRLGLLSEGDCNFFDSRADGYVMGEGAAIHLMTTYKKAREYDMQILGEINDCAVRSSVPDHLLSPSEKTFVSTINETYHKSGIRKQDIQHLDLFAFSNIFGDIVEKQVVENCFDHEMHCGNVKPQFGYFKAANPAVAMAKLMLMNHKGKILPDFNYESEHSILNDSKILKPADRIKVRPKGQPFRFASNVNGIGGNHCHMIMSTLPAVLEKEQPVIEAQFKAASGDDIVLIDHAYSADNRGQKLRMVALLSGQGAQRSRMMKELFEKDAHIRMVMEKGERIFVEQRGYSLLDMMFGTDDAINSTQNTQPAVFLSSAAVYSRLSQEGFSPDYFIGHSVGEYTALFCSGMLGFEDAMRLIIKRSDLMYDSTLKVPGKIMVVFKNEKETEHLIRKSFVSNIYITNKNSEKQTAVSGKAEEIEKFCAFLTQQEVFYKKLNLTGAFHTPLLKDASDKLRAYLDTITFNETRFGRIISNTIAGPYPERRAEVKDLLARQIISPVEFIKSIEHVYASGRTHFIEIGPSRLLVNLLKNINIGEYDTAVSVDAKVGEVKSFDACRKYLADCNSIFEVKSVQAVEPKFTGKPKEELPQIEMSEDFESFKLNNSKLVDQILFKEYQRQQRENAIEAIERYNFNTNRIVISGVSVGLPGKTRRVFASDNFDAILNGENFIDSLTIEEQEKITDKNIIKLYKQPDGNARFVQITKTEDVIHLAGQLGYFDLTDEYGIKEQYDITMGMGIAAGIEALKDANIPLVMQYKKVKDGKTMIPNGFALPEDMQEETGVIITSLWPNGETLMSEMEKYFYEKLFLKPYEEFENIYYFLMEKIKDLEIKERLTDWFFKAKARKRSDFDTYKFDRNFLANACPLGSAHLAQIIKAKGPNTLVSSACASTTLAIGIAEDWIRVGRCKRVLVVGGENATSTNQNQWVGSGFLALGAATIKKRVSEAAKPFDEDRNGTILGSGAVGLVIESETCAKKRGMNGQCEILGTHIANSAYHTYNIDVPHMSHEMDKFITKVEQQNGMRKKDYADKLLFMSHETYTPARGGSADAEVTALETTFAEHLNSICISNTKGFTGHTLGAAVEDVVLVKALQKRKAPPIANLKKIPEHFKKLSFSGQDKIDSEYGLHLAAGFGSHFAFMFVKRVEENAVKGNDRYQAWLQKITGSENPELKIIDNTLCAVAGGEALPSLTKKTRKVESPGIQAVPAKPTIAVPAAVVAQTAAQIDANPVAVPGQAAIFTAIKTIIAEQTGYTVDMLEKDLDLEADLGIDTVKQVEIFGNIASRFGFSVPDDLKLRDLNTIDKLGEYVETRAGMSAANSAAVTPDVIQSDLVKSDTVKSESRPLQNAKVPSNAVAMIRDVIAEQTGYTVDMLEDDLDLEADLGIDTVKQVEIFAKISSTFGFSVPDDLKLRDLNTIAKLADYVHIRIGTDVTGQNETEPDPSGQTQPGQSQPEKGAAKVKAAAAQSFSNVVDTVREVIAEQTGYTTDMLEDDLDLEADLGIDTVKQVEIFAKVSSHFGFSVPDDLKLRDLNTIAKLAEYVQSRTSGATESASGENISGEVQTQEKSSEAIHVADDAPAKEEDAIFIVKQVISAQTGYTQDMLEDDLDLEADLGIDTVKQVEIFAKVASHFGFSVPDDLKLRDLNTIAKLADYIKDRSGKAQAPQAEPAVLSAGDDASQAKQILTPSKADDEFPDPASPIKRLIVRACESDVPQLADKDFKDKKIIVSLDSHGFAKEIIKKIQQKQGEVITIGAKDADFAFDLTDVKATEKRVEEFKKAYPQINGFIHLAPLDSYFDAKGDLDEALNTTIKSFFVMIKSLFENLDQKETLIGTISFDSVVFPYMEECGDIHPLFAGLSGLMKTVNKELSDTMVKVVDFSYKNPKKSVDKITDLFLNELLSDDTQVEVGYKNKKRYVISMKPSIADKTQQIISDNDTMLVTGGAGGITYEIIKKVVTKYKTNLIILDINDIYSTDQKYLDKASTQPDLMALLKADMPGVKPVEIKRALDRLMRVRQSIDNIETLQSMGVSVEYNCVDVTDADAVKATVDKYERIDGVFHAAGMEMSQFIPKKELWSFELVVDVKVKGMRNLLAAFQDRDYKYFFTFSSVTARFGNEGQADYTAANDFLGKTLFRQKQLHPERTYKVYAWTAWGGVGMATNPTVKMVLEERGIQFLPMDQGVKFFMADLLDKTESEMVFSGLDYSFDKDGILGDPADIAFPFLDTPVEKTDTGMTYSRVLDIERDLFLHDHTMDGVPLFLGATGIETMAEVAGSLSEDKALFVELSDFQIPYGIKLLKQRPKELLISGKREQDGLFDCRITSVFKNPNGVVMGDPKLHYEGKYRFAQKPLKTKKIKLPEFKPVSWKGDLETLVYNPKRLFMFGLFNTITDINSFDGTTLVTTVQDNSNKEFFKGVKNPNFVAAPILVDAMFQTGGLLEFFTSSRTVLPYKIKSFKFYKDVEKHTKYFCITQKTDSGEETNTYDLTLVDEKGVVFIEVDSFEMVKLNRLDSEDQIADQVEFSFSEEKVDSTVR